jgi:hypothetical protein
MSSRAGRLCLGWQYATPFPEPGAAAPSSHAARAGTAQPRVGDGPAS